MEVRRDPRSFLFFIILLLLINSPSPEQQGFDVRQRYEDVLEREWDELDILNRTRYGDLNTSKNQWLNISGLREEDGFAWDLLRPVQQRAREQTKRLLGASPDAFLDGTPNAQNVPVYRNISGYIQGEWSRSPLGRVQHPADMNTSTFGLEGPFEMAQFFDRNLTGTGGTIRIHITELEGRMRTDENRSISEVTARVVIGDNGSVGGNWWEFVLNGVHFPRFGGSILTTTSDR